MGVVVHLISDRHAALGETKTKMLLQGLLFGLLVNTITSVPAPGHFFHHGYHGYHGYHPKCTTELEAVTKTLCRIEVEKECETTQRPTPRSPAMRTQTARRSSSRNQFTSDTAM